MKFPEWSKIAWATAPIPGFKRLIVSSDVAAIFSSGPRELMKTSIRYRHQVYCLPSYLRRRPSKKHLDANGGDVASRLQTNPIASSVLYPVCIELEVLPQEIDFEKPEHVKVVAKWLDFFETGYREISALARAIRPHAVVFFQGYLAENAILRRVAIENELPFLAVENTAFEQKVVWDNISGLAVSRNLARNHYWKMEGLLSIPECNRFCENYLAGVKDNKHNDHKSPTSRYAFPSRAAGSLRIVFLGQVLTDASIIFGTRQDLAPIDVIKDLVRLTTDSQHHLVIKLHPKENAGASPLGKEYASLTARRLSQSGVLNTSSVEIDSENRWNTYDLIEDSDIIVTHSSQAGLEAAIAGKPVILCGEAFYRGLGFTIDAASRADLHQIISQFDIATYRSEEPTTKARQFVYTFCKSYCISRSPRSLFRLLRDTVY